MYQENELKKLYERLKAQYPQYQLELSGDSLTLNRLYCKIEVNRSGVKLYVNESYRGSTLTVKGGDDLIRMLFPQKLEKGETVYGEAYQSGDIMVFNDDHVIGEVPSEYLEPQ